MTSYEKMMEEHFGVKKPKLFSKTPINLKLAKDPLIMEDDPINHKHFSKYKCKFDYCIYDNMTDYEIENFLRNNRMQIELKLKQS